MAPCRSRPPAQPQVLALFGELALAAYDGKRAEEFAQRALPKTPGDLAALRVLARAYVLRGDADHAIATARTAVAVDPARGGLELAEVLAALDRVEEAHQQLESLRGTGGIPWPRSTGGSRCSLTSRAT